MFSFLIGTLARVTCGFTVDCNEINVDQIIKDIRKNNDVENNALITPEDCHRAVWVNILVPTIKR